MKDFILKVYDYFSVNKGKAAALLVAIILVCIFFILRSNFSEDISTFLPHSEKTEKYQDVYKYLASSKIAVFFRGESEDEIREAMDAFSSAVREKGAGQISGDAAMDIDIDKVVEYIGKNAPVLLSGADIARADSLLEVKDYIPSRLAELKNSLYGFGSTLSTNYLRHDPLGLFLPALEKLQALNPLKQGHYEDGYIFTEDGGTGILFLDSPAGGTETSDNRIFLDKLNTAKLETSAECPEVEIFSTGAPEVAVTNADCIRTDAMWTLALAMLIIITLLWLSFKRLADVFWIFATILFGVLFSLGVYASVSSSVSLIIVGICTVIMGLAANYPIHFADHLKYQPDKRKALAEQVNPLLVGNITTVGAFLSLLLLRSQAMHDFGIVGAITLVCTIVFVLVFLPVFLPVPSKPRKTLELNIFRNVKVEGPARGFLVAAFLALTLFFAWKSTSVSFDADISHINYMTDEQKEGFAILSSLTSKNSSESTLYIVSEGDDAEAALQADEAAPGAARRISLLVPSKKTQEERIAAWNAFKERHPGLEKSLKTEAGTAGFTDEAFEPFYATLGQDFQPQDADYFQGIISAVGQQMFFKEEGKTIIISYLDVPKEETETITETLSATLPGQSFVFSQNGMTAKLIGGLSDDFNNIGFICGAIVFIFLLLSFRRVEITLLAFLPLAIGWLWILGMMSLLDIKFNIVNFILASFIFGQGDDYTIFITEGLIYEYATGKKILSSYKNAVALSAIIMFVAIGVLILSRHPALRSLAELTIVGMFTVVVMAWFVPPIVFRLLLKYKQYRLRKCLAKSHEGGAASFADDVRLEYLYKGHEAGQECRKVLCKSTFEKIDNLPSGTAEVHDAGYGVYALLLALTRKDITVYAYEEDEDKFLTASRCSLRPRNLIWKQA
ncbi:MAG: hypothetical protein IJ151_04585 [Bacteroidales bacterium]|nr:hypothetical protein [Bacteroidales bacterium]